MQAHRLEEDYEKKPLGPYLKSAELIRRIMAEKDLKAVQVAKALGVTAQFVYSMSRAIAPIPAEKMTIMSRAFEIDINEIIHVAMTDHQANLVTRIYAKKKRRANETV